MIYRKAKVIIQPWKFCTLTECWICWHASNGESDTSYLILPKMISKQNIFSFRSVYTSDLLSPSGRLNRWLWMWLSSSRMNLSHLFPFYPCKIFIFRWKSKIHIEPSLEFLSFLRKINIHHLSQQKEFWWIFLSGCF